MRAVIAVLVLAVLAASAASEQRPFVVAPAGLTRAPYAEWAHSHWVWPGPCHHETDQPCINQEGILRLVREYLEHDLPVGNVIIDAGWETHFNSFIIDTTKFPNMTQLVRDLHALGVRVTFWMTGHVNNNSPNFQFAKDSGYFLNDGELVHWWLGDGALIDFTNPEGLAWWKSNMDTVLDMGADGWKLDATDPYVYLLYPAYGYQGRITKEEYSDQFYRTFYEHSLTKNPEALIMSRPMDALPPGWKHTIRIPFTPQDICVACWVGDQDAGFYGLQAALLNMFASAKWNYANIGSDIGGYRSNSERWGPDGRPKDSFVRWAQVGALNPLMENGGQSEHRPWKFDDETLETYRVFVYLHEELRPFFLSKGTEGLEFGIPVMQPQGKCFWRPEESYPLPDPCPYEFMLANDIFVAAVVNNQTTRLVTFPSGADWLDWWDERTVYSGNSSATLPVPITTMPLFRRVGAVIPLQVPNSVNRHDFGIPLKALPNLLTLLVVHPFDAHGLGRTDVHERHGAGVQVRVTLGQDALLISLSATARPILFAISGVRAEQRRVHGVARMEPLCTQCPPLPALDAHGLSVQADQLIKVAAVELPPAQFDGSREVAWYLDAPREHLLVFVPEALAASGAVLRVDTSRY